jgi:hypothetical protein
MENHDTDTIAVIKLPLWRRALEQMRAAGLDYEKAWPVEFFEKEFRANKDAPSFAFEMMGLRKELEDEDGYYLRSSENGKQFYIVAASAVEDVAQGFEQKLRRFAKRAICLRSSTLTNEKAKLTEDERRRMEQNLERASVRLLLISRQQSIAKAVNETAPNLLQTKAA